MSNSEISDKSPSKNKRYYCNDCVCGFNTLQHYNYHLESKKHKIRISKEATLHICSICQKNFSYLSNLYRHRSKIELQYGIQQGWFADTIHRLKHKKSSKNKTKAKSVGGKTHRK